MTGAEAGVRRLFVGGPWHGQVHEIPAHYNDYLVPSFNQDRADRHGYYCDVVTYQLATWGFGNGRGVRHFVLNPTWMTEAELMEALAIAAGLEILGDK